MYCILFIEFKCITMIKNNKSKITYFDLSGIKMQAYNTYY